MPNDDYHNEETELELYIENESKLYPQKKAIIANFKRKVEAGKYDATLAVKGWLNWVDAGARMYVKEFHMTDLAAAFPKKSREKVAKDIAEREYAAILRGEYGPLQLLEPKPAKKPKTEKAARPAKMPRIHLSRIHLNRQGYTSTGRYFGVGAPVFYASNPVTDGELEFRAVDRPEALRIVKALFETPSLEIVSKRFTAGQIKQFTGR